MNIVVTGASKGIGKAIVEHLAANQTHTIIAIARNEQRLNAIAQQSPHQNILPIPLDLTTNNYQTLLHIIKQQQLNIDVLINNAGYLTNKPLLDTAIADFTLSFAVNCTAAFTLSKALFPYFKQSAHIVNISSMGGIQQSQKYTGLGAYSVSKGALCILTECMAAEWQIHGIAVNCLAPGAVPTEMFKRAFPGQQAPVTIDSMAAFIAHFATNAHHLMTGKIVPIAKSNP